MSESALDDAEQDAAVSSRGSSFYAPMRILPRPRREAMFEIYSFCRAVDDIADEGGPREARTRALGQWRANLDAVYAGAPTPPGLRGLAEAIRLFGLQREDFFAVIDGMQMDVDADIRAPDAATLDLYCDRVASAVGRLSVRIFGIPPKEHQGLAHHLGRAFQLTNILRDIDEDAAIGRLYLPREALLAAGISPDTPPAALADVGLDGACAPLVANARTHFEEARTIMARCPRESLRAPKIMAEVYESILDRLIRRGFAPPRKRVRTPRHRVILAVLRYGLF
jgi:phytoene synthase